MVEIKHRRQAGSRRCVFADRNALCIISGHEADYLGYQPVRNAHPATPGPALFSAFVDRQHVIRMRGRLAHVLMCRFKRPTCITEGRMLPREPAVPT